MNIARLKELLTLHEARRTKLYKDSVGKWTIGVGHNIDDKGLPEEIIDRLLEIDIDEHMAELDARLPWWRTLSEVRQLVIADMAFNLGVPRLLNFRLMLAALRMGDNERAAVEMLDSTWAKQVGPRATRLAKMMRTGEDA